ncbi:MBL fold metallo-hydrolase [Candidatus Pacearchaeota archaeon]|nr:MBL fold metallo-hydrolase [Candidatus Pacearchaeota archaeon]
MEIEGVKLDFLGHSGFLISVPNGVVGREKRIAIDPYNLSENIGKVDYILITHSHYDHCSIKDIEKISQKGTGIVVPADAQSKITRVEGIEMQVIEVGDEIEFTKNIKVQSVPAYNLNKNFHQKSEGWFGFLLKIGNVVIYHSGDSDKIPEMQKLTGYGKHGNKFIVLLPVSGTYVMTSEEAAEVAIMLKPDVAIPMHYGSGVVGTMEDALRFVELCKKENIDARILERI